MAVLAALGGAGSARAAPPWGATVDLAPPLASVGLGAPDTAVARDGTRFVAFTRLEGDDQRVEVAHAAPGGGYEPAVAVSAAGGNASGVDIAVDRQGNATVAWLRSGQVQVASRPAAGSWGVPQVLAASGGSSPTVAAGGAAAAVAWTSTASGSPVVVTAVRAAGAPVFDSTTVVSTPSGSIYGRPRVAMDAAGDVAVLWQRYYEVTPGTPRYVMETAVKPASSGFAAPQARSALSGAPGSGAGSSTFDVTMTASGRALAIWDYYDGTSSSVQYAERVPGSTFGSPASWSGVRTVSAPGADATAPRVATTDDGTAAVVWQQSSAVESAVRGGADAGFSAPEALSGTGASASSAVVAMSPGGEGVVAWTVASGDDRAVLASRRRPGESGFGDPVDVVRTTNVAPATTTYGTLSVGLDDQGNGALTWLRAAYDGATVAYVPQTTVYDPVAPTLTAVDVPGSAVAGTPAAFSASAVDRVSSPALSWDFGDGTTAAGDRPSHAYGGPGTFAVTVVATDGVGNTSSATRTVQVTAPVAPGTSPSGPPLVGGGGAGDADGDGVAARLDCDDHDAKIRPGATEVRGNAIDEDCDGKAAPLLGVGASASLSAKRLAHGRTRVTALRVSGVRKGDVVGLTCKGGGCRKAATRKVTVRKGTSVSFTPAVRGMVLRPGATLVVKVARKGFAARVVTFTTVRGKAPRRTLRCQDPGAARVRVC